MNKTRLFFVIFFAATFPLLAQERNIPQEGEIEEGQVIIKKELEIELPPADRNFEKVPPSADMPQPDEDIDYDLDFVDNNQIPNLSPTLRVLKIKTEKPETLYGNYLKAGIGNYFSPYLGLYLHNTRNDEVGYGASFLHYSAAKGPVDGKNSGDGHSQIRLNGKYMGGRASIAGKLGYNLDVFRFYGYDGDIEVDRDTIKQVFNEFEAGISVENTQPGSDINVKTDIGFSHIDDRFDISEDAFNILFNGHYNIREDIGAGLDIELDFRKYKIVNDDMNRNFASITPFVTLDRRPFFVKAGLRIISQNDSLPNITEFSLYPTINVEYHLNSEFIIYGLLDGNVEKFNFTKNADINPYIKSNVPFYNTNKRIEFGGGIKGTALKNMGFDVRATVASYENMFFYVNDTVETNKFSIIYDTGGTTVFNLGGSLSYTIVDEYGVEFSVDYNGYETKRPDEAWHKPKLDLGINAWYNIYEKIILSTELNYFAGIKARDAETREMVKLDPAFDWNAEINYLFSEKAGAFLMFNNIFGTNYELLYKYPVRGLQVRAGVTLNF